ncbi:protein MIS12 homolog [Punica granatum]|uniref:Protein MIS12 homolog n=1 Tax=Punica granatum TaxID=22663 RepID=A0A6P8BNA8_PUNGR|nr:protein MIS12 homolog [Punica granatum]
MEGGGESEATFESLKLNPQIFINEVLNSVDDLLDEALRYYHQQASASLKTGGTDRDQDLSKGVDTMRNMVQSVLDSHLGMWEKYCLRHCFKVPEGFSLTKPDELPDGDSFMDTEPDTQLETLRNKLYQATKESAELSQELQALERQSVSSDHSRKIVNEVLQSCEQSSANEMIQEIMRSADELRLKIGTLKNQRTEEKGFQRIKDLKIDYLNKDVSLTERVKGLCAAKLEDLRKLSDLMQI